MKKLLLSSVALFGLSTAALAADLPRRQYVAPPPIVAVPVFTWTGFYVGVNAGYGFSDRNKDDNNFFNTFAFGGTGFSTLTTGGALAPVVPVTGINTFGFTDTNRNRDGFVGGGQIGYNYQFTPGTGFVVGVEADIQWADFNRRRNDDFFGGFGGIRNRTRLFTAATIPDGVSGNGLLA